MADEVICNHQKSFIKITEAFDDLVNLEEGVADNHMEATELRIAQEFCQWIDHQ
jgi:hypothetical protein